MLTVHVHGHRRSGRRNRPTGFDRQGLCVDHSYIVFLFIVVVNCALAVGDGLFYPTFQIDGFHYSFLHRIYRSGILAVAVKGEDKLRRRIIDKGVGVRRILDFGRRLQAL